MENPVSEVVNSTQSLFGNFESELKNSLWKICCKRISLLLQYSKASSETIISEIKILLNYLSLQEALMKENVANLKENKLSM